MRNIKGTTDMAGERYLLSAPEPTLFEYKSYKYSVTPLNMRQKRKWVNLSKARDRYEKEYFKSKGEDNPYLKNAELLAIDYGDTIPNSTERATAYFEAVAKLDDDGKKEFTRLNNLFSEAKDYAFDNIDNNVLNSLICEVVTVIDRDEYTGSINSEYIDNWISIDELSALCGWIDEVSTLTDLEVLGLR
jgi:hypothetical protein